MSRLGPRGDLLPSVTTPVPGARGRDWVDALARSECPAFTARRKRRAEASGAPTDPIVWASALGANVEDVDGNVFVDFTSGFGVAAVGHRHPLVVAAITSQANKLIHGLGDVYPSDVKIMLLERLAQPHVHLAVALAGLGLLRLFLLLCLAEDEPPATAVFVQTISGGEKWL